MSENKHDGTSDEISANVNKGNISRSTTSSQIESARKMVQMHTSSRYNASSSNDIALSSSHGATSQFPPTTKFSGMANFSSTSSFKPTRVVGSAYSGINATKALKRPNLSPTRKINVKGWNIQTTKKPILNASEIDNFEEILKFPLPEMIFGNNSLSVESPIIRDGQQVKIEFNCLGALKAMDRNSDFKVSYAKEWKQSRSKNEILLNIDDATKEEESDASSTTTIMKEFKMYDWTYSSNYLGEVQIPLFREDENKSLPIEKLKQHVEIKFSDEIVLYEDELGDNGISMLTIKIRVMNDCLLILQRLFMRIDNVIFKIRDVRYYVNFDTFEVIREFKEQAMSYDKVASLAKLECRNDIDFTGLLRNSDWLSGVIPVSKLQVYSNDINNYKF